MWKTLMSNNNNHIISECSKFVKKEYKTGHDWVEKSDPQGIVQENEIWPFYQMVYTQARICPEEWNAQNSQGLYDTNTSQPEDETKRQLPNSWQERERERERICQIVDKRERERERTCQIVDKRERERERTYQIVDKRERERTCQIVDEREREREPTK